MPVDKNMSEFEVASCLEAFYHGGIDVLVASLPASQGAFDSTPPSSAASSVYAEGVASGTCPWHLQSATTATGVPLRLSQGTTDAAYSSSLRRCVNTEEAQSVF